MLRCIDDEGAFRGDCIALDGEDDGAGLLQFRNGVCVAVGHKVVEEDGAHRGPQAFGVEDVLDADGPHERGADPERDGNERCQPVYPDRAGCG